ncbi:MAG TPA: hypothetical protein ENI23_11045 [bacterium]|nr:hypothetical protein [bacterium]
MRIYEISKVEVLYQYGPEVNDFVEGLEDKGFTNIIFDPEEFRQVYIYDTVLVPELQNDYLNYDTLKFVLFAEIPNRFQVVVFERRETVNFQNGQFSGQMPFWGFLLQYGGVIFDEYYKDLNSILKDLPNDVGRMP